MSKQIKASLDEIVEAVIKEMEMFSSGLFDVGENGYMYPIQTDYIKDRLRTALERFVVEGKHFNESDCIDMLVDAINYGWDLARKEANLSEKELDVNYLATITNQAEAILQNHSITTTKKGGHDEA